MRHHYMQLEPRKKKRAQLSVYLFHLEFRRNMSLFSSVSCTWILKKKLAAHET